MNLSQQLIKAGVALKKAIRVKPHPYSRTEVLVLPPNADTSKAATFDGETRCALTNDPVVLRDATFVSRQFKRGELPCGDTFAAWAEGHLIEDPWAYFGNMQGFERLHFDHKHGVFYLKDGTLVEAAKILILQHGHAYVKILTES